MSFALRVAGFVFALLAITTASRAQSSSDLVYVGGRLTARAPLDDRAGKREDRSLQAAVRAPSIALGRGSLLGLGAAYRYTGVDLGSAGALANEPSRRDLHALDLSVAYTQFLGRRWMASLGVVPGLRTDFDQALSSRDFQLAGFALVTIAAAIVVSTAWAGMSGRLAVHVVLDLVHPENVHPVVAPPVVVASAPPSSGPPDPVAAAPVLPAAVAAEPVVAVASSPPSSRPPEAVVKTEAPAASAPDPNAALFAEAHRLHFPTRSSTAGAERAPAGPVSRP